MYSGKILQFPDFWDCNVLKILPPAADTFEPLKFFGLQVSKCRFHKKDLICVFRIRVLSYFIIVLLILLLVEALL